MSAWTCDRTPEQVVDLLQRAGVAAGVVQNAHDVAQDKQLAFRRFFVSLDHPTLGTARFDRSALLLEGLERKDWKSAPSPGEDNDYVLEHSEDFRRRKFDSAERRVLSGSRHAALTIRDRTLATRSVRPGLS